MAEVMRYDGLGSYGFDELPKGDLISIRMNPYNGKVFVSIEKHKASASIALDIMREVVEECSRLESNGSLDPLRDYLDGERDKALTTHYVVGISKVMKAS